MMGGSAMVTIPHRDGVDFPEGNVCFAPHHSGKSLIHRQEKRRLFEGGWCMWSKGFFFSLVPGQSETRLCNRKWADMIPGHVAAAMSKQHP